MKAVVMAGGEGTRLRPLTCNRPKPMVPVVNKPIIQHIFELLRRHSITDIAVTLYYLADEIESFFGDGSELGLKLSYSIEDVPLGTAGSVRKACEMLGRERVIVISGDALTDIDLDEVIRFHEAKSAMATIVTTRVPNPLEYGIVVFDEEGRIRRFLEKPSWGQVFSDTVNTGIYVLEPEVLDYIDPGRPVDFSQDVFPKLLHEGERLFGFVTTDYWCDVGNLQQYREAQIDAVTGKVNVTIPGAKIRHDIWVGEGTEIDPGATLAGPLVIGRNCRIGKGAGCFEYSFIGDNCIIEEDVRIHRSVLWPDSFLGQSAEIGGTLVGQHAIVKDFVTCHEGVVIGDRCRIGQGATLQPHVKIWPNKVIESGSRVAMSLIWGTKWPGSIFKERGVTGLTNIELTPEFAMKLGASFGSSIGKGATVTTSRDDHPSSRMILRSIICGLMTVGVNILDLRSTPLPVSRYNIKTLGVDGGLHIRISPDNPRYTLVELFNRQGINLPRSHERKVENLFFREDFRRTDADEVGKLEFPGRVLDSYVEAFFNYVDIGAILSSRKSIVIDYAYSRLSMFFPSIFGRLGCEMVALNAYPDHSRIPKTAEDRKIHLDRLSKTVSTLKADIGVLIESDGERLSLVDEGGRIIEGNTLLAAIAWLALKDASARTSAGNGKEGLEYPLYPLRVAVTVDATGAVEEIAGGFGAEVFRTRQDPRSLMEFLLRPGQEVLFAGDGDGGFIFPSFQPAFDAMFTLAKVLQFLAGEGLELSSVVDSLDIPPMVRKAVTCPWEHKGRVMRVLAQESEGTRREFIDGLRMFRDDGWVLILPDPAEATVHIYSEATTHAAAAEYAEGFAEKISEIAGLNK
ncbi:MAG TPA: NTP transferase domain-containing protein [Firmicutes bacterium]|nr:NTP transferase domain-containing protein [Bacillota bacterium]